ncbi:MAG: hypothetical protein HC905_30720 [Bacteroidales bacterium]|nr:hypothetical protein [Bacteroidales bacterium]
MPFLFLLLLTIVIGYIRVYLKTGYQFSGLVLVVLVFAMYTVDRVMEITLIKNRSETRILASNLANQHDQIAEYMLEEQSARIEKDSTIANMLFSQIIDEQKLKSYINKTFFTGYFDKYKLQTIPCHSSDSLFFLPPDNYYLHCKSYFQTLVETDGTKLPSSLFYHIDNKKRKGELPGMV